MSERADLLNTPLAEPLEARWRHGREARGLALDAPFAWDAGLGLDEIEELIDAAIYRRERLRAWYGPDPARWPAVARARIQHALDAIEELRAELRVGPLA